MRALVGKLGEAASPGTPAAAIQRACAWLAEDGKDVVANPALLAGLAEFADRRVQNIAAQEPLDKHQLTGEN